MARYHKVEKARKDYPDHDIKKGDTYYWWSFRFGGKHYSKTQPKQSQLTQSDFLATIYGIGEDLESLTTDEDDIQSMIDDIVSQLEDLRDEQEEKRSNMPDQLQDSEVGELLQERYDNLDDMINELQGVSLDEWEEPDIEEVKEDEDEKDEEETEEEYNTRIAERIEELKQEKRDEILEEIQAVSYSGS